MKIIHVVPSITKEASGPSYSVKRLCDSLMQNSHEVTLATLEWGSSDPEISYIKTFPIGFGPKRLGVSNKLKSWLNFSAKHDGIALIHNHGMWQMNSIYPAWAINNKNVQLVYSPRGAFSNWAMKHGSMMKRVFWPLLQRPALKKATCFHATSEAEYEDIRRLGFRQPVAIIPNGIDVPLLTKKSKKGTRTLFFLGRIHVVKGLDLLLRAWEKLQYTFPDWRLVIAGGDDGYYGVSGYLEELKSLVSRLKLERVEFTGPLYGVDKVQAYQEADLYVLPSRSENFAVSVAEALASGTPALVSKGAPWSALETKNAGWWVDIDVESLIGSLEQAMAKSSDDLELMGINGRNWMQEDFSWDRIGLMMSETYIWLANKSNIKPEWIRLD